MLHLPFFSLLSRIQGTTAVEISSGLHWYLKYWCGAHISWDKTGGNQVASVPPPGSLPRVEGQGVKLERPVPWNYYQNVVTSSCKYFIIYFSLKKKEALDLVQSQHQIQSGVKEMQGSP